MALSMASDSEPSDVEARPTAPALVDCDWLAWVERVEEPLTAGIERALLIELARSSQQRAAIEKRIDSDFAQSLQECENTVTSTRAATEARRDNGRRLAESTLASAKRDIQSQFTAEHAPAEREYAELQERVENEFNEETLRAKRKLKEARWEAETVFDATKDGPGKRLEEFRKKVETFTNAFHELEKSAQEILVRWRQTHVLDLPNQAALDSTDTIGNLQEKLQQAERARIELSQLSIPPLFQGSRLTAIFIALWTALAIASWLLIGNLHALWISLIAATAVGVGLSFWLHRLAKRQVEGVYPRIASLCQRADLLIRRALTDAEAHCTREQQEISNRLQVDLLRADSNYQERTHSLHNWRETELRQAQEHYPSRLAKLVAQRDHDLQAASVAFERQSLAMEECYAEERAAMIDNHRARIAILHASHQAAKERLAAAWRAAMARLKSLLTRIDDRRDELFPDWSALASFDSPLSDRSPPAMQLGQFDVDLTQFPGGLPADAALASITPRKFTLPALLPFPEQSSLLIKTRGPGRSLAVSSLQSVMLRLLTALPPGKVRFTIIDPVGLGENFAAFMHLADYDESMVANRIWTEPRHIEQRLADLSEHMENVIQKYLRNEFKTIEEYNSYAGEIAEPFRFLVIANFPINFSEEAARRLLSIMGSGARCGVSTLISVDTQADPPHDFQMRDLEQNSTVLLQKKESVVWKHDVFGQFPLKLELPPDADDCTRILHTVGRNAKDAGRVEVPFEFIAPSVEQCWTSDSRRGIDVPLGRAGATRLQHLKLGHGTSQHVLVAGQTGSGKSTLLHALITNLALRYSPDEVELYLVDFKKGVEFKTYATHCLPHARVVAIESDREFGLSVLERLDAELKIRADRFRELGVQDINGFRQAMPGEVLPRILLIVDEFQELFVEDDKIAQNGALLLDRLVRQGRAFGVHLLLGSQTLGGAYSLARSTIGQIGVRIALRCSEVDAHLILSEENSAARLLSRAGEAIYNDTNGLVEGNHPFQVVWLGDEPREAYLECVQEMARQQQNGRTWNQVVFEGNIPAEPQNNRQLAEFLQSRPTSEPDVVYAWLGEAVAIKEPTAATFRAQSGSNLLIVGQNDEPALGITTAAILSLLAQLRSKGSKGDAEERPRCFVLDGTSAGSPQSTQLAMLESITPGQMKLVSWREMTPAINAIATEVTRRGQPGDEHHDSIFLVVYGLQRFRDLRKAEDDFSFSRPADNAPPNPAKQFATILREGPGVGIHTIVWCDSLNNLNRAFDRQSMREFEMRVVFQMSGSDSSTLIDTPIAGKLGPYRALYNSEEHGCLEKFRPYGFPTADWLDEVKRLLAID